MTNGGGKRGPWGPAGSGGQKNNPWSNGGPAGPGGQQFSPEDLERLIRQGQQRFRQFFPPGGGGGRGLTLAALVLVGLWLLGGFYQVGTNQIGVVLRFGEVVRTESPGLRYHLPSPIEQVLLPDVTSTNRVEVGFRSDGPEQTRDITEESMILTSDENIIDIDFVVFWQVQPDNRPAGSTAASPAEMYLFNIRDPELTVKMAAESAMREVIGQTKLQPALTGARTQIEDGVKGILQRMLDEYRSGILVTQVQLTRVAVPQPVVEAFNDVQRARQEQEQLRNQAESYRNDILPRARGETVRMVQEAQGYKERVVAEAQGNAQRFTDIYNAYAQAREVTARRLYLETMEQILRGATKVVVDNDRQGGGAGVVPFLPLQDLLRQNPAASGAAR